jgi:hypothetical protein
MPEFWKTQDIDLLYPDQKLSHEYFNDDAYGRLLDKLSEINEKVFMSEIALNLLKSRNQTVRVVHFDTTSKS